MAIEAEDLAEILRKAFEPGTVEVVDDSARHAGHAGAASGGGHYIVRVVSESFRGRTQVSRHRMVYDAVGQYMGSEIHALALETRTPDE